MSEIDFSIRVGLGTETLIKEIQDIGGKKVMRAIAREVVPEAERYMDRLIDDRLRVQPPKRGKGSRKFRWSDDPVKNARGRRGFFARHPNGYTRTGRLVKSWNGSIDLSQNRITVSIINTAAYAGYVYGSETFGYRQVPGHRDSGWLNSGKTVPNVVLDVGIVIENSLTGVLDREVTKALRAGLR